MWHKYVYATSYYNIENWVEHQKLGQKTAEIPAVEFWVFNSDFGRQALITTKDNKKKDSEPPSSLLLLFTKIPDINRLVFFLILVGLNQ